MDLREEKGQSLNEEGGLGKGGRVRKGGKRVEQSTREEDIRGSRTGLSKECESLRKRRESGNSLVGFTIEGRR